MIGLAIAGFVAALLAIGWLADRLDGPTPAKTRRAIADDNTRNLHEHVLEETFR